MKYYLSRGDIAKIYALSRNPIQLGDPRIIAVSVDLEDVESIKKAALGIATKSLDLVIVATGILHDEELLKPEKRLKDLSANNMTRVFLINAIGPALIMQHFLPLLKDSKKVIFVALSARVGSISDNRLGGWHSYRASKAALNMLIKTTSIEYSRVNKYAVIIGLHPGTVDTKLSKPYQAQVDKMKLFSSEVAVVQLARVLDNLQLSDSGKIFSWDGKEVPP